jgi:drug/metabolite transporter (DMT)-like permease
MRRIQCAPVSHSVRRVFFIGLALAVGGSVMFSAKAVVVKLAYRHGVDAATLLALRMLIAWPFFAVAYAIVARGATPLSRADHARLIGLGLIGYYLSSYLDFLGLQHVSAGLGRLILYLNPTLVLLLSAIFLGKRIGRIDVVALALAYGGIVLALWHDVSTTGSDVPLGAALVFASAACYAVYLVVSGEMVKRLGAIRLTSYAMLVSTVGVVAQFLVLKPISSLQQPAAVYGLSIVNAMLCTVLPVFAAMMAVERIGAGNTSLASMVGVVSTIFLAWVFLGEAVSSWQLAGAALVLGGIYVLSRKGNSTPTPLSANERTKEVTS